MEKYSDKFLNDYKVLSKAIIGFEFECYFNDISYYKVLELLNQELSPVKVHGFRTYHSDFKVDANNFKIERDLSGGENMCEIITGPLDYYSAKYYMIKILRFIDKHATTTDKSSLHINLSFIDKELQDLNILKQILTTDEDEVYKKFPSRKNNVYCKSIKKIIPFKDYNFSNVSIGSIKNVMQIPDNKYYGINFQNVNKGDDSRLEIRYIGGKNYEAGVGDILYLMDKIIIDTYNNIGTGFTKENINELSKFLEDRINSFKSIYTYDDFLVEYPNIEIQIDQDNRYEVVSTHYSKIYEKIFDFLESIEDIKEGVINFFTETNKIEIVGANFTALSDIHNIDFIKCDISGGIISDSNIHDCDILNSEISRSKVDASTLNDVKLISCNVDRSELNNCFFQAGLLNSYMEGGIFRSGQLGPDATLSDETKIVGRERKQFFGKTEEDIDKKSK